MDIESLTLNEEEMATSPMKLEINTSDGSYAGGNHPQTGGAPRPHPPLEGAAGPYAPQSPQGAAPPVSAEGHDPEPTAPPSGSMDQLPGYSNIGFEAAALPPPAYDEATNRPPPNRESVQSAAVITDQDARDAILQHVNENCCYGRKPALDMQFSDMKSSSAFHYTLETFGESRSTKWVSAPYVGEAIIVTGPPPSPWDISEQPTQMFLTRAVDLEVPNTASVKPCYSCRARGFKTCLPCFGRGTVRCTSCDGNGNDSYYEDGMRRYRPCSWCRGGFKTCSHCNGSGQVMCGHCKGRGQLRWFIVLTIQWTNHVNDHIVERTALPDELIRTVSGQVVFEETNPRVWAVNHFPEQEINTASNNLVSRHGSQFNTERILMQRHRVRIIPVTEVFYNYKDRSSTFFVYGDEHKVYAPDYPAKCCCGCAVL